MIITSTWKKFTTAALAGRGFALHVQIIGALVRKEVGIRMRMSGCVDLATKSNYLLIRSQATRRVVERGKYKEDIVRLLLIQQWEMAMKLSKREGKSVLNMNTAGLELIIYKYPVPSFLRNRITRPLSISDMARKWLELLVHLPRP